MPAQRPAGIGRLARLAVLSGLMLAACHSAPKSADAPEHTPASGPAVRWAADLDQRPPKSPEAFSQPVVIRRGGGWRVVAGGMDARLHVLDAAGREIRRIALDAPVRSGAVELAGGLVVVADTDGGVYGIDPDRGRILWKAQVGSMVTSTPVRLGDGFVIQTVDNRLYRFTARGEQVWAHTGALGGLAMLRTPSPLVHGDTVVAVFTNGDVVALKAGSGILLWKHQLLLDTEAAVLSELKVPTAQPVWVEADGEDRIVVPVFQGELNWLSARDGSLIKTRRLSVPCTPLLEGDVLYAATSDGRLLALDAREGETRWAKKLGAGSLCGPADAGSALVVAASDGRVFAVSREGAVRGVLHLPGRLHRAPVPAPGGVLVRAADGIVRLIKP